MSARHSRYIQTGRAQLLVDVTTLEKPGQGYVTITAGSVAADKITALTVGGVSIIGKAVAWATSHAVTAQKLADEINRNVTAPRYHARAVGAKCYIWQQSVDASTYTIVCTVAAALTVSKSDVQGGVVGDGTSLGYTQEGFDLFVNDEFLKESTEESGTRIIKEFYTGENVQIGCVLKQWDEDAIEARFPGRHSTASDANRIEIPGELTPGDDMEPYLKTMCLVPDNKAYPALLIRKGMNTGQGSTPIRFRATETKKLALLIDCLPDEDHTSTDYETVGVDLLQNLSL